MSALWLAIGFIEGFVLAICIARSVHNDLSNENAELRKKLRDTTNALHESNRLLHGVCDRRM